MVDWSVMLLLLCGCVLVSWSGWELIVDWFVETSSNQCSDKQPDGKSQNVPTCERTFSSDWRIVRGFPLHQSKISEADLHHPKDTTSSHPIFLQVIDTIKHIAFLSFATNTHKQGTESSLAHFFGSIRPSNTSPYDNPP